MRYVMMSHANDFTVAINPAQVISIWPDADGSGAVLKMMNGEEIHVKHSVNDSARNCDVALADGVEDADEEF